MRNSTSPSICNPNTLAAIHSSTATIFQSDARSCPFQAITPTVTNAGRIEA
jgi:hypothetical protein